MYNINKNATRINGELRGESWSPPRFGTNPIEIHHCNGCYIRWSRQRTTPCNAICGWPGDISENTREQAEEQLKLWRKAIESKGLGIRRSKTAYLPPSSCHDCNVKLGGEEIKNITTFNYLWLMLDAEGESTTDCHIRVRLAWSKWREVTGVRNFFPRRVPTESLSSLVG